MRMNSEKRIQPSAERLRAETGTGTGTGTRAGDGAGTRATSELIFSLYTIVFTIKLNIFGLPDKFLV